MRRTSLALAALLLAGAPPAGAAQPAAAPPSASGPGSGAVSLQGDRAAMASNPFVRAFYDLAVADLGTPPPDRIRFERESRSLFQRMAAAMHVDGAAWSEHVRLIPGQMADAAAADPKILGSYAAFLDALLGPP